MASPVIIDKATVAHKGFFYAEITHYGYCIATKSVYNVGMARLRWLAILLVIAIALGIGGNQTLAQTEQEEYFEETGHSVVGEFLEVYLRASNPVQLYGYPITDAFQDTTTDQIVQYFQKARFELHTGSPAGQRIQLSPLGEYLYQPGQTLPVPSNSPACRSWESGRFQVCYAFLEFFDSNGGEAQFGKPISNLELHEDIMTQYFQRARFEWHPNRPAGQRVVLADLGTQYFYARAEDTARLLPNPGDDIIKGVLNLQARAYPSKAVTGRKGTQTIYIVVQDQRLLPIAGAKVSLVVHLPSGEESRYTIPTPTNAQGITQYSFDFAANTIGSAEIEIIVSRENLSAQTVTSFRIWW